MTTDGPAEARPRLTLLSSRVSRRTRHTAMCEGPQESNRAIDWMVLTEKPWVLVSHFFQWPSWKARVEARARCGNPFGSFWCWSLWCEPSVAVSSCQGKRRLYWKRRVIRSQGLGVLIPLVKSLTRRGGLGFCSGLLKYVNFLGLFLIQTLLSKNGTSSATIVWWSFYEFLHLCPSSIAGVLPEWLRGSSSCMFNANS